MLTTHPSLDERVLANTPALLSVAAKPLSVTHYVALSQYLHPSYYAFLLTYRPFDRETTNLGLLQNLLDQSLHIRRHITPNLDTTIRLLAVHLKNLRQTDSHGTVLGQNIPTTQGRVRRISICGPPPPFGQRRVLRQQPPIK